MNVYFLSVISNNIIFLIVDLAEQGIRTLWGSFEVKNKKLVMKQIQQHVGVNLEDEFNKDPESFMRYAKKFRKLGIKYLKFHGAENVSVHAS